jgi:lipoyl(octanoyl) transferase
MPNIMSENNNTQKAEIQFKDLGVVDFSEAWKYQQSIFNLLLERKLAGQDRKNYLVFCEHPHVYTLGKSGDKQNLLITEEQLNTIGATYFHIDRGGDITYHGPGQVVGYPIFDLEQFNIMAKKYIYNLEEGIIRLLHDYQIQGERKEKATGIWLDAHNEKSARKICAIGVKISRSVTMHGFALNVNTDLQYYQYINPCGFNSSSVTSIKNELGKAVPTDEVKNKLRKIFTDIF